jgi:hypothetical protein
MPLPKLGEMLDALKVSWQVAAAVAGGCAILLYLHSLGFQKLSALPGFLVTAIFILFVFGCVVFHSFAGLPPKTKARIYRAA